MGSCCMTSMMAVGDKVSSDVGIFNLMGCSKIVTSGAPAQGLLK